MASTTTAATATTTGATSDSHLRTYNGKHSVVDTKDHDQLSKEQTTFTFIKCQVPQQGPKKQGEKKERRVYLKGSPRNIFPKRTEKVV